MTLSSLTLAALAGAGAALLTGLLPSAVYHAPPAKPAGTQPTTQVVLQGRTLDLRALTVQTCMLPPGQASRPRPAGAEELLIVQEGQLAATLHDTTTTLGPGGMLLAPGGAPPALRNTTAAPARYWVLQFKATGAAGPAAGPASRAFARDWPAFTVTKTDKGETRPVFDRPSPMFPRFDVHATVLNPGRASHPPHTHRTEEIVLMTRGQGEMQIDGHTYPAAAGDVILLEANVPHAFTNNSPAACGYFAIQWHSPAEQAK